MLPDLLRRNVDDVVAADNGQLVLGLDLSVLELLRVPEDEIEVRVETVEGPPVSPVALHFHHDRLVEIFS